MKFLIVVPTYNEIEKLRALTEQVFQVADARAHQHGISLVSVLVVDDNSPDGTGQLAEELAQKEPRIHVLHRQEKAGLGKAYVAGFAWGLREGFDAILEMDADFSHNPQYLPEFWRLLKEYDVVIGSRYVTGGGVKNWGLVRRLISRGGSVYARNLLGLPVKDMTGGFNAWRREVLEKVDISNLRSEGYAFQIELKWRAHQKGFRITEFPIVFEDRAVGQSKMSKKIVVEAMMRVASMRMEK
ncbi:MAG: polyprenol monophosphomannose synthase [Bdellovibrionales bacterium]|nr:polyprenol monophosphomannose synthase [Bdellovibrionales bacterium]